MYGLTPFERGYDIFDTINGMTRDFFGDSGTMCRTDIRDEGDKYVMEAELPGFDKDDITLDINGDRLTLSAKRSSEGGEKDRNGRYIRRERSYGTYRRSFDISGIDSEKIGAEYKNGVLLLELPKLAEQPVTSRRLEIK